MVRNAMTPFTRNSLGFEPNLDRWLARTLELPFLGDGTELRELENHAEIRMDVPGARPEQVSVTAEQRTLTVRVERDGRGEFSRQFTVGPTYDLGKVEAKLEHGVLTLTLAKAAEAQPRAIPVTIG